MTWARDKLNGLIKSSVSANTLTPLGLERVSGWEEFKIELIKINVHCWLRHSYKYDVNPQTDRLDWIRGESLAKSMFPSDSISIKMCLQNVLVGELKCDYRTGSSKRWNQGFNQMKSEIGHSSGDHHPRTVLSPELFHFLISPLDPRMNALPNKNNSLRLTLAN